MGGWEERRTLGHDSGSDAAVSGTVRNISIFDTAGEHLHGTYVFIYC